LTLDRQDNSQQPAMREIVNHGSKLSPSRGEVLDLWTAEEFVECRCAAAGFLPERSENLTKREFGVLREALSNLGDCPREVPMWLLNQRCCDRVHESAAQQCLFQTPPRGLLAAGPRLGVLCRRACMEVAPTHQ